MSWWATLNNTDDEPVEVNEHEEGGTFVAGGTAEASLNVTYNYGKLIHEAMGVRFDELDRKTGAESLPLFNRAISVLGTDRTDDYWEPTKGNAGYALNIMRRWAGLHPDAVWEIT